MKSILIAAFTLIQFVSIGQYMGVGDKMGKVINDNEGKFIGTVIQGELYGGKDTGIVSVADEAMKMYYFNGISLNSRCYKVDIDLALAVDLNKLITKFNKECVIISEYKWEKRLNKEIYDIQLKRYKQVGSITITKREQYQLFGFAKPERPL